MSKALKLDQGKVPLELLPFEPLVEVGKVLAFGAEKYGQLSIKTLVLEMGSIGVDHFAKKNDLYQAAVCFAKYLILEGAWESMENYFLASFVLLQGNLNQNLKR